MKIYFAPCGIGLGHVGRVVPIARRLVESGVRLVFSTYSEGIEYIKQEKLPLIESPPVGFKVKADGSVDFRRTAIDPGPFRASVLLLRQIDAEVSAIERFGPDVVVSDSRASSLLAARLLKIPRVCILNQFQPLVPRRTHNLRLARFADMVTLTLIGKIWTSVSAVLIPDFPPPYTISAGNLTIPRSYKKNVRLIGPILPVRPDQLPSRRMLIGKLGLPTGRRLIFVPLSGPKAEKAFVTEVLRKILLEFPDEYEIVMSYGYPSPNAMHVRHRNLTTYNWIPNRFEYLKACDLVIGRAGHGTITQCMCYGKPMILIPTPGHTEQISNAQQAANIGVAKIALQDRLNRERLLAEVKEALSTGIVERASEVQEEALKHDGLESAVNTVTEIANN